MGTIYGRKSRIRFSLAIFCEVRNAIAPSISSAMRVRIGSAQGRYI
jgi:hypothetical protein